MQDPVVVVGLGRSGIGAARLLNARGADVWLLESNSSAELKRRADELNAIGIQVELGKPLALESFEALPRWPSTVVISPGIAFDHPVLNQLRDRGCRVVGEVEVAWQAMAGIPWIGITGTNGKTTVTSLVAHLLQQGASMLRLAATSVPPPLNSPSPASRGRSLNGWWWNSAATRSKRRHRCSPALVFGPR